MKFLSIKLLAALVAFCVTARAWDITDYLDIMARSRWRDDRAKTALVLSGGAARGLAHVGVVKCWKERRLPVDMVVGTSVGALVGALYSSGMDISEIEKIGSDLNWSKLVEYKITPLRLLNLSSIVSNEKMGALLENYIGDKRFSDLKIPFICVACDLRTGEKIIFKEGNLIPAVRASASIPGIFEPVVYKHRLLVDGGVIDNVPTDIAEDEGADMIVASWAGGSRVMDKSENIISILTQVISISGTLISRQDLKKADIIIAPDLKGVSPMDLDKFDYVSKQGYKACAAKSDEIVRMFLVKTLEKIKNGQRKKDELSNQK